MADEQVTVADHSMEIMSAFNQQLKNGMNAIGLRAENHAKANCPVDTGRLRNSITFATADYHSPGNTNKPKETKSPPEDAEPKEYEAKGQAEERTIYIGTNVEYAEIIETHDMHHESGRAHFLRDAATTHNDEYKEIMEAALKA